MEYCLYYQAKVEKRQAWFFVAVLRSYEHVAFDRTFDKKQGRFEFFVPQATEDVFLGIIHFFIQKQIVTDVKKMENRLCDAYSFV